MLEPARTTHLDRPSRCLGTEAGLRWVSWYGESDEVEFTLTARTRNYPPGAGVTQDVIVMEDSAPVSLPCWVQNLSSGSPYESWQALYIYRSNIEMLEGLISPEVSCMHSILRMGGMLCSELGQQV